MDDVQAQLELHAQARNLTDDFLKFAKALDTAGAFDNVDGDDIHYFLEKPWKWATAYAVWHTYGKPMNDEDPADVAGWRRFLEACEVTDL